MAEPTEAMRAVAQELVSANPLVCGACNGPLPNPDCGHRGQHHLSCIPQTDDLAEAVARALATQAAQTKRETMELAAAVLRAWSSTDEMKLRAGEMTAQEVRTVKAVLGACIAEISSLAPTSAGKETA